MRTEREVDKVQFLDLKSLAERSSLSVSTCRKLIRMGLPHYRVDRKILVDESEYLGWIQRFKINDQSDPTSLDHLIEQTLDDIEAGSACDLK